VDLLLSYEGEGDLLKKTVNENLSKVINDGDNFKVYI